MTMPDERHAKILSELARYTGKRVSAAFVQRTANFIHGIERFHTLLSGIYKPAWSAYALSIVTKSVSPYDQKDEIVFLDDGRWLMTYSPRSGGLDISDNRSLVRCLDDHTPLAVIQQVTDKTKGSTYKVLGLGIISGYDAGRDVFIVESADLSALTQVSAAVEDEKQRYEVVLYAELNNEFRPFMQEDRVSYVASLPKRDEAFREVLLTEYDYACAICEMKFVIDNLHEAQAAHIVPKNKNGTDDPRNGLTLCRAHHWALDAGLFTLTSDYAIVVSPLVPRADSRKFEMLSLDGRRMQVPRREMIAPHR